jgi:hypothetical protein
VLLGGRGSLLAHLSMVTVPRRLILLVLAALLGAGALVAGTSQPAAGQASLDSERAAAERLRDAVAAETRRT